MRILKKAVVIILILTLTVTSLFAAPPKLMDTDNVAPVTSFEALKLNKKNVDLVVVTDYVGADLAGLKSKLTQLTNDSIMSHNIKIKYIDNNAPRMNVGTQNGTFPVTYYGIAATANYTWSGQQSTDDRSVATYTNKTQSDTFYLNTVALNPGQTPPAGINTPPAGYWYEDKTTNGMFGGGRDYIYHFNGYPGTYTFWINYSYINGSGGSIIGLRQNWTGPTFSYTTNWTPYQTSQSPCTNTVPALDFRGFNGTQVQPNSDVYIIFALNNTSTDYYSTSIYNQNNATNYMLGNMRADNMGKFVQDKKAHVYSIAPDMINNIKLSESSYKVNYSNTAYSQSVSISDLINTYTTDGRKYEQGQYAKAIDNIAANFTKPKSNKLDLIIATDKSTEIAASYLNTIKSSIPASVNVSSLVLDNSNALTIGVNEKPNFTGKIQRLNLGAGYSQQAHVLLKENGDLFATGSNCSYAYKSSYYGAAEYKDGLFGVDGYSIGMTKIMSDVASYQIFGNTYHHGIIIVKKDGTVWGSGANFSGAIAPLSSGQYLKRFTQIEGISNVKKVLGYMSIPYHEDDEGDRYVDPRIERWKLSLIFLTNDGKIYGKGEYRSYIFDSANMYGDMTQPTLLNDISGVTDVRLFQGSWGDTLVAGCSDGTIKIKGINNSYVNPTVTDNWKYYPTFTTLYTLSDPIREFLAFGYYSNYLGIVTENYDFYVLSSYNNYNGDLGTGQNTSAQTPRKILSDFKSYHRGGYGVSYFITNDNKLYFCGSAYHLLQGIKGSTQTTSNYFVLTLCSTITDVDMILSPHQNKVMIRKTDGSWYLVGNYNPVDLYDTTPKHWYYEGHPGNTQKTVTYTTPQKLIPSNDLRVTQFVIIDTSLYAMDMEGDLFTMEYNSTGSIPTIYTFRKQTSGMVNIKGACNITYLPVKAIDKFAIRNKSLSVDSERYFIYISDHYSNDTMNTYGAYFPFGNLTTDLADYLKVNNFYTYTVTPNEATDFLLQTPYVPYNMQNITLRQLASSNQRDGYSYRTLDQVVSMINSRYEAFENLYTKTSNFVINEDVLEYKKAYLDYENDLINREQFMYEHDPSVFENNTGKISNADQWLTMPITMFTKKGKYIIHYRAEDHVTPSNNFASYRKWSNESTITIFAHERPVALTNVSVTQNGSMYRIAASDGGSYDNDHVSRADKGIVAHEWRWMESTDALWHNEAMNITSGAANKVYYIEHRVQDLEGAWSHWSRLTLDNTQPPVAQYILDKNEITTQENLRLKDTSFAYFGTLVRWQWIVVKQNNNSIISNTQHTNSNNGIGTMAGYDMNVKTSYGDVGPGTYRIYLRVKGSNGLWSDGGTDALAGYNLNRCFYQDITVKEAYKLEKFRVVMIRDIQLEIFYKNPAPGLGRPFYINKPMYVSEMAIDASNFNSTINGLTKGYRFEFEIDSTNFNEDADEIVITPKFYTCDAFTRDSSERELYWEDSDKKIFKVGEGGHSPWKTITLSRADRTIFNTEKATWRGEYLIPATSWAVPANTSLSQVKTKDLKRDIIVHFEIKGYKNGVLKFDYNAEQWGLERTTLKYPYQVGDVIRYSWSKNLLNDINIKDNR